MHCSLYHEGGLGFVIVGVVLCLISGEKSRLATARRNCLGLLVCDIDLGIRMSIQELLVSRP